jgi:hypothetical protein
MLLQGKILRNLFIGMVLMNAVIIGLAFYLASQHPWLPSALFPGKFGTGVSLELTGNNVVLALLLVINALAVTVVGFKDCLHAMWAGMRFSPKTMRKFLNEKAGLASDISGVVAAAVQEEEKLELSYIDRASWVLRIGLILFGLSLPLLAIALARADAGGPPMFARDHQPVANNLVSNEEAWRFTGDQVAGALLLDIPEVFDWRVSPLDANTGNFAFAFLVVLYRTVIGFGVLLAVIATARMRALWRYAMEVAMPVKDIVAMEPALAAGRGHEEYRHSREEPNWREHEHAPVVVHEHESRHVVHEPEPVVHKHETAKEAEHRHEVEAEHLREEARRHEALAEEAHREAKHDAAAHKHHNDDAKAAE